MLMSPYADDVAKVIVEEGVKVVTTCLAMTKVLEEKGLRPDVTAGLSLGEFCAISVAGGMKEMDAIKLVRKRGILMQNTIPEGEGAMAAILGMEAEVIKNVIKDIEDVTVANYNCPGQIVITGKTPAVEEAAEILKNVGAKRVVMLNVSGPFHSPMLVSAGEELRKEMETMEFSELKIPYVTNVTAEYINDISETKELLAKQVSASVRWQESMEKMIADDVDTFVEIGPGKTLNGFLRKIDRNLYEMSGLKVPILSIIIGEGGSGGALAMATADEKDIAIVQSPVGMPGRAILNPFMTQIMNGLKQTPKRCMGCLRNCNPSQIPYCITQALINAVKGNVDEGLLFCGANVWKAEKIETVKEVMDSLLG